MKITLRSLEVIENVIDISFSNDDTEIIIRKKYSPEQRISITQVISITLL